MSRRGRGRCGRCSSAPAAGLSHVHVGSLHAPDEEMAVRNARDLYTRRGEGVSIWVVPSDAITASDPDAKGAFFELRRGQELPARHLLHAARRGEAPVTRSGASHVGRRTRPRRAERGDALRGVRRRARPPPTPDVAEYALWLGDDALVLAQRLGQWISRAPELEEDVALANIALDLLGHARSLLRYAGCGDGRTEDDLAYWRDEHEFRSAHLFEQPNGDFAHTIVRQFAASALPVRAVRPAARSADPVLAGGGREGGQRGRLPPRPRRPVDAAPGARHGRVPPSARRRALDDVWPYVAELFRGRAAAGSPARGHRRAPSSLRDGLRRRRRAGPRRGRAGGAGACPAPRAAAAAAVHSEHLGHAARRAAGARPAQHPGAHW